MSAGMHINLESDYAVRIVQCLAREKERLDEMCIRDSTRAYTQGAVIAVEAAGEVDMRPCLRGDIDCSYAQYGMVAPLVAACGGVVEDAAYGEACLLYTSRCV